MAGRKRVSTVGKPIADFGRGKGKIWALSNGHYRYRAQLPGAANDQGVRGPSSDHMRDFATEKEARDYARRVIEKIDADAIAELEPVTLAEFGDRTLRAWRRAPGRSNSQKTNMEWVWWAHLRPALGGNYLHQLRAGSLQDVLDRKAAPDNYPPEKLPPTGYKPATPPPDGYAPYVMDPDTGLMVLDERGEPVPLPAVRGSRTPDPTVPLGAQSLTVIKSCFAQLMRAAALEGLRPPGSNPADDVRVPLSVIAPPIAVVTPQERDALLCLLPAADRDPAEIMARHGTRLSETFNIDDDEVTLFDDLSGGTLYIPESKTPAGQRTLTFGPSAAHRFARIIAGLDGPGPLFRGVRDPTVRRNANNWRRRSFVPAVATRLMKDLDEGEREALREHLAASTPQMRLIAELLMLPDLTIWISVVAAQMGNWDPDRRVLVLDDPDGLAMAVQVPDRVADLIDAQVQRTRERMDARNSGRKTFRNTLGLLMPGDKGRPLGITDVHNAIFEPALTQLRIGPRVTPHALRHSWATTLIRQLGEDEGVDREMARRIVSKGAGHTRDTFTEARYVHELDQTFGKRTDLE